MSKSKRGTKLEIFKEEVKYSTGFRGRGQRPDIGANRRRINEVYGFRSRVIGEKVNSSEYGRARCIRGAGERTGPG